MVNFKRSSEGSIQEGRIPAVDGGKSSGGAYHDPWNEFGHRHATEIQQEGDLAGGSHIPARARAISKYGGTRLTGGARGNL